MATGISIHVGINQLDKRHYNGTHALLGCHGDAEAMRDLAQAAGFEPRMLIGQHARADALLQAIDEARPRIGTDGLLLVTFSGHGGRVRDYDGDEKMDGWDETWCLYDRQVVDDELYFAWKRFPAGARILVVSDSCYSGDVIRDGQKGGRRKRRHPVPLVADTEAVVKEKSARVGMLEGAVDLSGNGGVPEEGPDPAAVREMTLQKRRTPRDQLPRRRALGARASRSVYNRHRKQYNSIQGQYAGPRPPIDATVLLLSAAADNQAAEDGKDNGAFTAVLLDQWDGGKFPGDYVELHERIRARLVGCQTPKLVGVNSTEFVKQRPFTI